MTMTEERRYVLAVPRNTGVIAGWLPGFIYEESSTEWTTDLNKAKLYTEAECLLKINDYHKYSVKGAELCECKEVKFERTPKKLWYGGKCEPSSKVMEITRKLK